MPRGFAPKTRIFVGNLNDSLTILELLAEFAEFGEIADIQVRQAESEKDYNFFYPKKSYEI